jgi:hypothetical protein
MCTPGVPLSAVNRAGARDSMWGPTFPELADGPQSLIVVPEAGEKAPHKKAEIEFFASKCIANCALPAANANASADKANP